MQKWEWTWQRWGWGGPIRQAEADGKRIMCRGHPRARALQCPSCPSCPSSLSCSLSIHRAPGCPSSSGIWAVVLEPALPPVATWACPPTMPTTARPHPGCPRPRSCGKGDGEETLFKWVQLVASFCVDRTDSDIKGIFLRGMNPTPLVFITNTSKVGSDPTQPNPVRT